MDAYNFTQASPSATWTITHGLNNLYPNVDVFTSYLGNLVKTIPLEVTAVDANTITVTFTNAISGSARVTS